MKVGFSSSVMSIVNELQKKIYAINRNTLLLINDYQSQNDVVDFIDFKYLLGVYSYADVNFLVLINEINNINTNLDIYEITKIKILQITPGELHIQIIQMLYDAFSFNNFYFSPSHPLHLPFSTVNMDNDNYSLRNIFIWNFNAYIKLKSIFNGNLDQMIVPVINGSIVSISNFCLISRRSNLMCGARFWLRGSDSKGNCANFIETESIVFESNVQNKNYKSFIQIRGSIPLHWTEYPNLTFLPPIIVDHSQESVDRFQRHINKIHSIYQGMKIYIVNLTSKKGREKELTSLYENQCLTKSNSSLIYMHIDTEQICGVFHWNRLNDEINKINFNEISFNEFKSDHLIQKQKGIIRTNCADSIDRTNLAQCEISILALKINNKDFESQMRKCWVLNGNKLANQIVGSNALKSEITLYKHRTFFGLLNDAYISLVRFYYDNFVNGYRQDCLDCITMNVKSFPVTIHRKKFFNILWIVFSSLLTMIFYLFSLQFEKFRNLKNNLKEKLINKPYFRDLDKID